MGSERWDPICEKELNASNADMRYCKVESKITQYSGLYYKDGGKIFTREDWWDFAGRAEACRLERNPESLWISYADGT